ncbi:PAS domain-containing protein [Streptomyces sp. GC420]|uniref:PAS domain-containing protein n=1 Tax=Streptomyces sp. GC420 TaxID=2697568 RepID=UPI0037DA6569
MSDVLVLVDGDWRVTFADLRAERLLGSPGERLPGRCLWEVPAVQRLPDLQERCRAAAARGRASGFDVTVPDSGVSHYVRLVPVPDGFVLYAFEATEARRLHDEEVAAIRTSAERGGPPRRRAAARG